MSAAVVLKCLDPEVMLRWETARKAEAAEYDAKCKAFRQTVGGKQLLGTQFYRGGFQVSGYQMDSYDEELPAGWRRERNSSIAVPAKRTPEGKAVATELAKLYLPDSNYPGVPKWLHCDGYSIFPGVQQIGEDWWCFMSKTPYPKDMEAFDSDIWAPVKLSEFYAAKEALEVPA